VVSGILCPAWLWLLAFFDDLIHGHRIDDDWVDDERIDELSDRRGSRRPRVPLRGRCSRAGAWRHRR
jgi:hypothetical protein